MLVKFDQVPGDRFAKLLGFIHSKENVFPTAEDPLMIVQLKSVKPNFLHTGFEESWYGLTVEIRDSVPVNSGHNIERVEPKYLIRVNEIINSK
jgi:hypothetical protein